MYIGTEARAAAYDSFVFSNFHCGIAEYRFRFIEHVFFRRAFTFDIGGMAAFAAGHFKRRSADAAGAD